MTTRWFLLILTLLCGCQSTVQETKVEAQRQWAHTRATVLYGVAKEYLKAGQLEKAALKTQEALSLDDKFLDARILLGKIYIEQGQYSMAVQELRRAERASARPAEAIYLLAVAQEKNQQLDEALANYREAYALEPTNLSAVVAATEVLVEMGRLDEARTYIQGFLGQAKGDPAVYEAAGRIAMLLEQYDEAARCYQQALDLNEKNLRYRESLGQAQFLSGQYVQAKETLRPLTVRSGYNCPAWVHSMLGDCFMAMGRYPEARDAYEQARNLQPESPGAWVNAAKGALAAGDAPRAILSCEQALHLEEGRLDATLLLGYALVRDGQSARAIAALSGVLATNPDDVALRCLLGRAYAASGNPTEAARWYAAALQIDPDNAMAKVLLAGKAAHVALPDAAPNVSDVR